MADNLTVTPGSGASVATDDIGGQHFQRMKVALGLDGTHASDLNGSAARGAFVDPRLLVATVAVTPTITTAAYTSGDCLGGLMEFANTARSAGGSGLIQKVLVLDRSQAQRAPIDLVFFDRTVTMAGDNAPFAASDADMAYCIGVLSIGAYNTAWPGTPLNSISTLSSPGFPYLLNGTSLFCQAVVRAAPTYAVGDLTFTLQVVQD